MEKRNPKITFKVCENGQSRPIESMPNEYPNLMFLLKETLFLDGFGECGGLGRCATCMVKVNGITGKSSDKTRNEPKTLESFGYDDPQIRLSCQIHITNDIQGAEISILEG